MRPHPAPHTDLPSLPRSHLHLPSAFTVWPDGQCEAGLALELSQAGDGAVLSPQPCPKLTVRFSPGLGLHWLLRHNQHTVTWRQHFPVYTATQPESRSTAGWGLGPAAGTVEMYPPALLQEGLPHGAQRLRTQLPPLWTHRHVGTQATSPGPPTRYLSTAEVSGLCPALGALPAHCSLSMLGFPAVSPSESLVYLIPPWPLLITGPS